MTCILDEKINQKLKKIFEELKFDRAPGANQEKT